MDRPGRPGNRAIATTVDGYLGWLARTLRFDARDQELVVAAGFARALAALPGATAVGPAMISRLESGTAHWRVEHLVSYARALGLPPPRLLAPAYKVGKLFGGAGVAGLLRLRYTDEDEQTVADLIDALYGDDPISTDNWDLLSGYLLITRRKLGMRTWALLCERLLLEICATQSAERRPGHSGRSARSAHVTGPDRRDRERVRHRHRPAVRQPDVVHALEDLPTHT